MKQAENTHQQGQMAKQTRLIILIFCIVQLILHLIADSHAGFTGDELMHIETGNHLAFGYLEFPPVIGLLAFMQSLFNSHAVFVYHLFPHIAMLLIIIYVGKITVEAGGKSIAVFIALFCCLVGPGFEESQQLFSPVVFSQLVWVLCFYQLIRFIKHGDGKYLWYLTIFISLLFLTKYDALFFCFGLLSLLLFRKIRFALVKGKYWQCLIISFLILLPNMIWQYVNGWPALVMFHRLYKTQLDYGTPFHTLRDLFSSVNPVVFILILPALVFMFTDNENKKFYRPLACSILLSVLFLAYCKGKFYYFYPIILTILPFCGVFWERVIEPKRKWLLYFLGVILLISAALIPFALPVYSYQHYLNSVFKYSPKEIKNGKEVFPIQEYYAKEKWKETLTQLQLIYDSLPVDERNSCLIWGRHYSQAGAVELFGNDYGLPHVFSYHGNFYAWAPTGKMPETVIAYCYNDAGDHYFDPFFEEVITVRKIYSEYASMEGWVSQTIYVCKKPRQSFDKMKELFKKRIFE
ncbi:MAG TPA: glycosyltransferase family 39 protein [Puia sp.]|nr:glycosyltransferase family 39 protein [Puia sp.]